MPSRYTNGEWQAIIAQFERDLVVPLEPYPIPEIGSPAFMKTIDHSLLKLEARKCQFDDLCAEARVDDFATVCVRPQFVHKCKVDLKGTTVQVASVIGFHEGTYDLYHKSQEAKDSLAAGATELDIVLNHPELLGGDFASIYQELATLRLQAAPPIILKLILETSQLGPSDIIAGCVLAAAAHFDFVKTSTGFNGPGAREVDVRLMAACCESLAAAGGLEANGHPVQKKMRVKASGGIKTLEEAVGMLRAGASRLGTSAGVWIAKEARERVERNLSPDAVSEARSASEGSTSGIRERLERPGMVTRLFTDY